ncbi:hypothetical protein TRIUR3_28493 [Triticum urartu]|uniref:Disease resistance N-terminal domain-containing protein n=1 Tax=Triticum urartu TaxID=4572 RepID=M7YKH2_TRIUA|nr:hypothetical protein TRIUR3_28493 [Triticum urartu]
MGLRASIVPTTPSPLVPYPPVQPCRPSLEALRACLVRLSRAAARRRKGVEGKGGEREMVGVGARTGALGSVIGKLTTLLGDEYTMLKRVRKDIEFLERELRWMQILVNSLANMEELDELAKNWKSSMRDLSYDMEECVDRFMLRLGNGDARPGFAKRTAVRLKTLFARHGIATQIKELKARVTEESERRRRGEVGAEGVHVAPFRTSKISN